MQVRVNLSAVLCLFLRIIVHLLVVIDIFEGICLILI